MTLLFLDVTLRLMEEVQPQPSIIPEPVRKNPWKKAFFILLVLFIIFLIPVIYIIINLLFIRIYTDPVQNQIPTSAPNIVTPTSISPTVFSNCLTKKTEEFQSASIVKGSLIIQFNDGTPVEEMNKVVNSYGLKANRVFDKAAIIIVDVKIGTEVTLSCELEKNSRIKFVNFSKKYSFN